MDGAAMAAVAELRRWRALGARYVRMSAEGCLAIAQWEMWSNNKASGFGDEPSR